jgi:hypothetical protein
VRAIVLALLVSGCATQTATLRLTPSCEQGVATGLDVSLSVPLEGAPVFQLPDRAFGSSGLAALISEARASDELGVVPLARAVVNDELVLTASRAVKGLVTLTYRARSSGVHENGARFGLRHDATGIGGLGSFFLMLPSNSTDQRTRIEWGESPCSAKGFSSFVSLDGPLEGLRGAAYFNGTPQEHSVARFHAAWFGDPAFDTASASAWAAKAFEVERTFFGDAAAAPYSLFVRVLPSMGERSNGMGQVNSFLSAMGPRTVFGPRLRSNLAHEMLHRWLGLALRFSGADGLHFWFTEGFTVHYAAVLMLRAGLISAEEFLTEVNGIVLRHFANPEAGASNEDIRRGFFDNDALSVVPYTRGALYAAELDAAIRAKSGGRRSLDELIRELGLEELPVAAFREAVLRELGPAGAERFDAVISRGETPRPPAEAYGACFTQQPRKVARYELGFDDRSRVIRGLIRGSAAASAGLLEGDQLISVEASSLRSDTEAVVTVLRAGKEVVVRFVPARAGETHDAWEWVQRDPKGCEGSR